MTNSRDPSDAIAAVVHPDPYPYYARLRREKPLHFDERLGLWVAAGAAVVREVLSHPLMRVRPPAEPVPQALVGSPVGDVFAQLVRMNDGDFHAQHKPRVRAATARWSQAEVEQAAFDATSQLAGCADANRLLVTLPALAVARLLHVAESEQVRTADSVIAFVQGIAGGPVADEAARYLMAQGESQGLSGPAAANRIALMQQSVDACAALIGSTARHFITATPTPGDWRARVESTLLRDPPVHNTRRFTAETIRLRGQSIAQGQGVLVLLASAVQEENAPELAFGLAVHACPGTDIALEIATAALRALHQSGRLQALFSRQVGFKPLPNARIPVFEN